MNPLLETAKLIGVPDNDEHTRDTADRPPAHDPAAPAADYDPPVGSYERFMNSFGNPKRWAGAN